MYNIGDKVKIHEYNTLRRHNSCGSGDFFDYAGQIVTIDRVERSSYENQYYIEEDCHNWCWYEEMIEGYANGEIPKTKTIRCKNCDNRFTIKYEDKECLCERCRKREFILPYHKFYPELEFYGVSKNENQSQLFLGIELEVGVGGECNEIVKEIMPILNKNAIQIGNKFFGYCSHDSSIDDGFEIITQPATIKYHKNQIKMYDELFRKLISMGYRSHNASCCGIHVHFNRDYYKENDNLYCARLVYLIEKFWDEIVIFSRRDKYKMDRYTKKIDRECDDFVRRYNKTENHDAHYYAINLANKNTIEFRMFRGTLNLNTFIAILDFVNNCVKIAKNNSTEEIQRMEFMDILTTNCKTYYRQRLIALKLDEV